MTGIEAQQILQKPVFGDERCIAALKRLHSEAEMREVMPFGWVMAADKPIEELTDEELGEELDAMYECGYFDDEDAE